MFTGLIEAMGTVAGFEAGSGVGRLAVRADLPGEALRLGESIAVDGVCLTLARCDGGLLEFDVVAETLARTTLGRRAAGDAVNLERSLRVGDRLGGHLVQGHVDAVAKVSAFEREGGDCRLRVLHRPEIRRYIAEKGSVALNGVSLTVAREGTDHYEVALIPETLERTNLGALQEGSELNVEVDLIARYLEVLVSERGR